MRSAVMVVGGVVVAVLIVFGLYLAIVLSWSYSDGERTGYLQKFSRKGWVCKTYEGELAMTTVPGVAPILWEFTVRDESVVAQINKQVGQRVVLHYEEHRGLPSNCFGDTAYFVDRIYAADGSAPAAAPAPAAPVTK
jgi:hypothetical protein